ncbi:MAG: AAA family ATPase [Candidatus Omnitrophota bacterium]
MYKDFYHFREYPFNVTADPEFFFSSSHHSEAFSHLVYGIQQRKGIIVISGEIGTGKTTLCRTLLTYLDNFTTKTAFIFNPNFSELQLLQLIVKDLGIESKHKNKLALIDALNEFLLEEASQKHNVVVIIDEAQNLKERQLEQIRLLSNLETEKEKLLQIILVGQPELIGKLKLPSLRQLNQRVAVRFHILPLQPSELEKYILHRLNVASHNHKEIPKVNFTQKAIELIYDFSKGTPRLINIICDRALLAAFVAEKFIIDDQIMHKCLREAGQMS